MAQSNHADNGASLNKIERIAKTLELTREGMTCRQIAAILDVSHTTIENYRKEGMANIIAKPAAELRQVHNDRLEYLWEKLQTKINFDQPLYTADGVLVHVPNEDVEKTVLAAKALLERSAKLNGVDAPQEVKMDTRVNFSVNGVDA